MQSVSISSSNIDVMSITPTLFLDNFPFLSIPACVQGVLHGIVGAFGVASVPRLHPEVRL